MKGKKRRRLKRFHFHPTTTFALMSITVIVISFILSKLNVQAIYNVIDSDTLELNSKIVAVENMLSGNGIKYIISNATRNFASFSAFINLMIALIGLSVAHASGFIKAFIRKNTINISNKLITFLIILLGIFSSLVNEVGYVILIPLAALIFIANKRSPLLGITTAFCGVSFGYSVSLFVGSLDVSLVQVTEQAARLIDATYHVPLLSNIFAMVATSIILAIVGTYIIEKIVVKKIGRYRNSEEMENTMEIKDIIQIDLDDKEKIERERLNKKGLRNAYIVGILMIFVFAYMIIPGLPNSGLLLDMTEKAYVKQLFGDNSYFQSGFTILVSFWFFIVGIAYAIGAKTLKNDKELLEKVGVFFKDIGSLIITMFFFVQFIAIFKKSNIGLVIACLGADLISKTSLSGMVLLIISLLVMIIAGFFVPSTLTKWNIFAPVVVPLMMQSNIAPEFAQFVLRAADSISKGFTPFLAYFIVYLGYLNIYNNDKEPITVKRALSFVLPYFGIIALTWFVIIVGWYVIGLPLGPGTFPTL